MRERGARNAGQSAVPTAPCAKEKAHESQSPRNTPSSGVPRAALRAFSLRAPAEDRCNPPLYRPPAGRDRRACALCAAPRFVKRETAPPLPAPRP
jgi:hypothetical protein